MARPWPGVLLLLPLLALLGCQGGTGSAVASDSPVAPPSAAATATPIASASPSESVASPATSTASGPSPSARAAVDPRADGLDVEFGEFAITLEAAAIRPGPVTLVVHNAGDLTHGFEMKIERSGKGGGGDRGKIETRRFRSGETLRVEADLAPGTYEIECYVSNHASRGMRTTLVVRADAPLQTPDAGPAPGTIRIVQFAFVPPTLDVPVGASVTWTNDDPTPHTVTADGRAFDSRQLDPGHSFAFAFDTAGVFPFHCEIHPTMVGEVRVE